jgi:sugar phosphate isomerase/epimerase
MALRTGVDLSKPGASMGFGLVTYLWGQDWDVLTLLKNCEAADIHAVELRTTHKHGVEPYLNTAQRADVKKRFDDSPVECVGPGSNERYDHTDPADLKKAIADTKAFIRLSHDIGATGVKVKPNSFHKDVQREKTIEQVGRSLRELAEYGAGFGQEIRLEVHGSMAELPTIRQVLDVADHPGARVCWNSNPQDLQGQGLAHNFDLVKEHFGRTAHVRELTVGDYPYPELIRRFVQMDYDGWILLEARTKPRDWLAALKEQLARFYDLVIRAQKQGQAPD